jgi:peptidoglycan DL-endopeptidase CwlO
MPSATLRARLGVTAATLVTALILALTPAVLATTAAGAAPVRTHHAQSVARAHVKASPRALARARARARRAATMARHHAQVVRVLHEARRQRGKPYVYGEDGPHGFDCSGLVRYVFLHSVHRSLPHNAAAQYGVLHHISRSQLMPGDLVFTDNGYISHVGIYDGHGAWWVAPHTGTRVQLQRIYHAHFVYARVLVIAHRR